MDMSKAYRSAVIKILPHTRIVFDRFHVMQLVSKTIDKVRNKQKESLSKEGQKLIKGSKYLLLTNFSNLKPHKQIKLNLILEANEPLFIMHTMKEQLRLLWECSSLCEAKRYLESWINEALMISEIYKEAFESSVLKPLSRLAWTLIDHFYGILSYFVFPITNGKMEGTNNKIKTLKRQAYGFRDKVYFKLRLLHLHAQKIQLAG
jgi:transposase